MSEPELVGLMKRYQMLTPGEVFSNTNPVSGRTRYYRVQHKTSRKKVKFLILEVQINGVWHEAYWNQVPSILQARKRELKEKGLLPYAKRTEDTSV